MRNKNTAIRTLVAGLACAIAVLAGNADPVNTHGGAALKGYDPVAYFTQKQPVKGMAQFSYQWMNAKWLFASAEDRDKFAASPEQYAPQYGGYCAYAVSQGHTAPVDPEAWTILDGKLYLNYSKGVQKKWDQDRAGYIQKADRNWPGLHK